MTLSVGVQNTDYNHDVTPLLGALVWVECLQIYLLLLVAHHSLKQGYFHHKIETSLHALNIFLVLYCEFEQVRM